MTIPKFPEFYALKLEDKADYEKLVSEYPPFSDIMFSTLHIWWNLDGRLGLSELDGNLVFNYSLPSDTNNSGWCIVGKHGLDESIQKLFAYLREHQRPQRLVHVPEFVVNRIKNKNDLSIEEEPGYHEYILNSKEIAELEGHDHSRTRRKVTRFVREVGDRQMTLKELDLSDQQTKDMVYEKIKRWRPERIAQTDPDAIELKAINNSISYSRHLDTRNLALYIDNHLQGIVLYHPSHDRQHYIVTHLKVDYAIPHIFDYMTKAIAEQAVKDGVPFLNLEMDLGLEGLRDHKQRLRPVSLFKKYRVEPK